MRGRVDLHVHSTASDGTLRPAEVVRLAERKRLAAVALTDHDTIGGLAEAAAEARAWPGLRFVPGVEVSARYRPGTMHILGLGIDPASFALRRLLGELRAARDQRNPRIIALLQRLGLAIDLDDVRAEAAGGATIGRLHIAQALRRKGYVRSAQEAFERYIGDGGPAYVDKERLAPAEVIEAIRSAGGAAVLAHPPQLKTANRSELERVVRGLVRHGLAGIEAYHTDHTAFQTRLYLDLARRLGLCVAGGSDFHGAARPDARLGRPAVPLSAVQGLLQRLALSMP